MLGDPLLVNGDPITLLAWPNYIAFAGLAIGIVVVACALGIGRDRRREIIVTVATFSALEIARWIYSVWKIVQLFYGIVFFLNPITYIVISVMILPLALCFNRAWRRS